jgi:hypothetical protein
MFQTNVVEKIEARILCSVTFFSEKHAGYEIIWKNLVEPDRPQMTIWRMRIAFWEPKDTYTHSEYVIFIAFPLQILLHQRASMLRYTCLAYLVDLQQVHLLKACEEVEV